MQDLRYRHIAKFFILFLHCVTHVLHFADTLRTLLPRGLRANACSAISHNSMCQITKYGGGSGDCTYTCQCGIAARADLTQLTSNAQNVEGRYVGGGVVNLVQTCE